MKITICTQTKKTWSPFWGGCMLVHLIMSEWRLNKGRLMLNLRKWSFGVISLRKFKALNKNKRSNKAKIEANTRTTRIKGIKGKYHTIFNILRTYEKNRIS
jgi:hypothetical protein